MGYCELLTNIRVEFQMVIFAIVVVSYSFTGFAEKGKIHERNLCIFSTVCLDSMGGKPSENRIGEFIITDEGIGPIQLGYQFREFIDYFRAEQMSNIKIGIGWKKPVLSLTEVYLGSGLEPEIIVLAEWAEHGDKTPDLNRKVESIYIKGGDFETAEGLKIGDSLEKLLSIYTFNNATYSGIDKNGILYTPALLISVKEFRNITFKFHTGETGMFSPKKQELPLSAIISRIEIGKSNKQEDNKNSVASDTVNVTMTDMESYEKIEDPLISYDPEDFFCLSLKSDMEYIVSDAQQLYRRPANMGGLAGSFIDYSSVLVRWDKTSDGTYGVISTNENNVTIVGKSYFSSNSHGKKFAFTMIFDHNKIISTECRCK